MKNFILELLKSLIRFLTKKFNLVKRTLLRELIFLLMATLISGIMAMTFSKNWGWEVVIFCFFFITFYFFEPRFPKWFLKNKL